MIDLVYKGGVGDRKPPPEHLSFRLAQKAGLELSQRQQLLEMDSENYRLEILRRHLTGVLPNFTQQKRSRG